MRSLLISMLFLGSAWAIVTPDREPAKDNSVEAEMALFEVHPEFEVSLYADESLGIAKPIAIKWDPRGRLWVLCTLAYAQLKPEEVPDDKLFILEDTDQDGRADKSTIFARGLDMPTGFALGHGGVYLGQGTELLFLKDTNGDDQADESRVLLTGFGTGDTHQNINNLVFDAGGFLYFCQGLHALSRVETPWGISQGSGPGFWRFDPRTQRLDPFGFPNMVSANPCGAAVDRWGNVFIKSNGPQICYANPGMIPTTRPRDLMADGLVGSTPGKSMAAEIVETAHQPDWLQQNVLIAGYFARQVHAIPLVEEGSGFKVSEPVRLLQGGHESFRPVDIRMGPDGGIYVADWFNPVINHYQVSLRHPHRDYTHGRIWKLTAKNRAKITPPALTQMTPKELFERLRSPERWTRDQARRLLSEANPNEFADDLIAWAENLDVATPEGSHALVEAVGVLESHGLGFSPKRTFGTAIPVAPGSAATHATAAGTLERPKLLEKLVKSPDPRARAVVARIAGRQRLPLLYAYELLKGLAVDPHPRVGMEAVVALSHWPTQESARLALLALDAPTDKTLNYALTQCVHALSEVWLKALADGPVFEKSAHLAFALDAYGGEAGAQFARRTLADPSLPEADRPAFLRILAKIGNAEDLAAILENNPADATLLESVYQASQTRALRPPGSVAPRLGVLLGNPDPAIQTAAVKLAGLWRIPEVAHAVETLALNPATPAPVRTAALLSFGRIQGKAAAPELRKIALAKDARQRPAMEALVQADLETAVTTAVELIQGAPKQFDPVPILTPVLAQKAGPPLLTKALSKIELTPEAAQQISSALARLGRSDLELTQLLNQSLGRPANAAGYDAKKVEQIVQLVKSGQGDPVKGRAVYQLAQLNCIACHQIKKEGGILGPPLDAVGAGLPLDQIVESVLYPSRQLKEGYFATAITTVDGQVHTGYIDREDKTTSVMWLRDMATQQLRPVSLHQVASRQGIGTLMPAGLADSLSVEQMGDLVAYLASLKE